MFACLEPEWLFWGFGQGSKTVLWFGELWLHEHLNCINYELSAQTLAITFKM